MATPYVCISLNDHNFVSDSFGTIVPQSALKSTNKDARILSYIRARNLND